MGQRAKYWSCTGFANWLRGTSKPGAQTGEGWNKWHKEAKTNHPIRYWIAEEGLDVVQNALWWPVDKLYDIKYYIVNRWVTTTHALTAHPKDLPRGRWSDLSGRILPCMFNELVEFVEVEKAWSNIAWSKEAREKYNPPFWGWGWLRWHTWRCPEAGIEHLQWETTLTNEEWLEEGEKYLAEPTGQAKAAKEILELCRWWKYTYPNRVDPHELSGWTKWCDDRRRKMKDEDEDARWTALLSSENDSVEERTETKRILDLSQKIEAEYKDEDTEMLIRLIKIRDHLWT